MERTGQDSTAQEGIWNVAAEPMTSTLNVLQQDPLANMHANWWPGKEDGGGMYSEPETGDAGTYVGFCPQILSFGCSPRRYTRTTTTEDDG